MENKELNTFEKLGLEVSSADVTEGKTYWIYGCITKFIDESQDDIEVELNFSIKAHITLQNMNKLELLKERAFEPGIFVCTMKSTNDQLEADCHTVVFGKKQNQLAC